MRKELTGYAENNPIAYMDSKQKLEHIRKTNPTLRGFVQVLKLIEQEPKCFIWHQSFGALHKEWSHIHDLQCVGCMGTLLAWFFDRASIPESGQTYAASKPVGDQEEPLDLSDEWYTEYDLPLDIALYPVDPACEVYYFETGLHALADYTGVPIRENVVGMPASKPCLEDLLAKSISACGGAKLFDPFNTESWGVSAVEVFEHFTRTYTSEYAAA